MTNPARLILNGLRSAFGAIGDLLSESPSPCPVCRTPAIKATASPAIRAALPAGSPLLRLCRACSSAIPWIEAIACAVCGRPDPCGDCARRGAAHFRCSRSAVRYDERIREWLALFKYRGDERLAEPLADMLDMAYLRLDLALRKRMPALRWDAVVPVPVSADRLAERGFNQAERLAALLAARRGLPLRELLIRTRHSEKKSLQSRLDRLRSVEGLFAADEAAVAAFAYAAAPRAAPSSSASAPVTHAAPSSARSLHILLVDDIYTTGSTINACAEALKRALSAYSPQSDVRIYAITVARS